MALKFRQKKNKRQDNASKYGSQPELWSDRYRQENQGDFRRSFVAIVVVMIIVIVILIMSAITVFTAETVDVTQITAADTFAVTSMEQQEMADKAQEFAQGILVYAYCDDIETATQGKRAALRNVASNTNVYEKVEALEQANPVISAENLVPVVTTPVMLDSTQVYAGDFAFEFSAVAADASVTSESSPNGTFVDNGYKIKVTFSNATNEATGEQSWIITGADITPK